MMVIIANMNGYNNLTFNNYTINIIIKTKGKKMKTNKIIIIEDKLGKFAFTKDESKNLVCQEIGNVNQIYFSTDKNEGGNLSDDWNIVDMFGLDSEYKTIVETAIKQLN